MNLRLTLLAVLGLVVLIFVLQNAAAVPVRFLFWKVEMSRALLLLLVFAIGVVMGWLTATLRRHRPTH